MDDPIISKVTDTITRHGMIYPREAVLAGVSGGPDSVALLHILAALAPRLGFGLGVAHLDHGLRGSESARDAKFVEVLAEKLNLPCFSGRGAVKDHAKRHRLSIEEAARNLRHDFFSQTAAENNFEKIALGHHRQDTAELVLMYLFRGSGPKGISGISPAENRMIRPLIDLDREEIVAFLHRWGHDYVEDSSNRDTRFLRNRIRHELLPLLRSQYNPEIVDSLNRAARIFRQEEQWMNAVAMPLFEKCVLSSREKDHVIFSLAELKNLHVAALHRVIRMGIETVRGNLKGIGLIHIDMALALLADGKDGKCSDLPGPIRLTRKGDRLILEKNSIDKSRGHATPPQQNRQNFEMSVFAPGTILIDNLGKELTFSVISIEKVPDFKNSEKDRFPNTVAYMDWEKVDFPMTLRFFRPGDRFRPLGLVGTQKLKDFFINNKVPRDQRYRCPILVSGGKIVWVVGYKIDDSVKIGASTKKVLKVEASRPATA